MAKEIVSSSIWNVSRMGLWVNRVALADVWAISLDTQMFSQMQKLGFFCALPMDPTETYMECRRV